MMNIQDTIPKSNFDIYQMILINIQLKLVMNKCCVPKIIKYYFSRRYYFPLDISSNLED